MEKLRLVTDFASLKAGDLVVVKGCADCGGNHRHLVLGNGNHTYSTCIEIAPPPSCYSRGSCLHDAGLKNVYLVYTGLEQTETTSKAETRHRENVEG